jgi:TRAP-type mannitol/chloroaromatic compound transport system substrate-binding protein
MIRTSLLAGLAAAVGLAAFAPSGDVEAQDKRVRWKMHSSFSSKLAILGSGGKNIEKRTAEISGGQFEIKFFEPGALLPGLQYFDAVAQGSVDAGWGSAHYNVGKEPALSMFASVPFGPEAGEYLAWMKYGGGEQIQDEINAKLGLKSQMCGVLPPEASGWFRNEIKSVDDLKGLKMRFVGLGAKVMEKFGVSTQLLAGGDIYPALELGALDATEFSMPTLDESIGLYNIAKHYYFPGWHQMTTILEIIMNRKGYDELSEQNKAIVAAVCHENMMLTFIEGEGTQFAAMQRMKDKGVQIHYWSPEILAKFRAAWEEVAAEEAKKSPTFTKAWESYTKFRADYAIWKQHGYLK